MKGNCLPDKYRVKFHSGDNRELAPEKTTSNRRREQIRPLWRKGWQSCSKKVPGGRQSGKAGKKQSAKSLGGSCKPENEEERVDRIYNPCLGRLPSENREEYAVLWRGQRLIKAEPYGKAAKSITYVPGGATHAEGVLVLPTGIQDSKPDSRMRGYLRAAIYGGYEGKNGPQGEWA